MTQFVVIDPKAEVNGQTVLSIVDGMGAYMGTALEILERYGISKPQPNIFYSQQAWLNAFKEISTKFGPGTLLQIGKRIPETANFPPQIDNIQSALKSIDMAYHMNHRGGEIGSYDVKNMTDNSAVMVCNNPYPCDFDRGIITAMSIRFTPVGKFPKVTHDDSQPCRKNGADSCTYMVTW